MAKISKEEALLYHSSGMPGKIEVKPTKPYRTQADLSMAYSPGVAFPCLEIQKNSDDAYRYTGKGNLVAVISNGTAVLGLGDIGAMSGKPVMEGKGLLFKIYGGINVFDIEVNENDPEKFCEIVEGIAPTFGGINLEDIKAPECFYIEERLKRSLDIPVMHDDQHGTAIISAAGLLNALEINGKDIGKAKIVVNGAGAAAISCTKLYISLGASKENIIMLDSKGVIHKGRTDLNEMKAQFAIDRTDINTLPEAIAGADVFVGLSKGNVLNGEMVRTMADNPVIFALANPTPEISYEEAVAARPDVIMATGRSDYPNQINNVIGFPYIFRGALDTNARSINEEMKIAAAKAIAALAKKPVPDMVNNVYNVNNLSFGPDYIIPKPVDPRLITEVSCAVAKAAMDSGVARKSIMDWEEYRNSLRQLLGQESKMTQQMFESARKHPKRVVFSEGLHPTMLKAAVMAKEEGLCHPVVLGNVERINKLANDLDLDLSGVEILNLRHDDYQKKREEYAYILTQKRGRQGFTYMEALDKMFECNYFGMMMVESGDADAFITGLYTRYSNTLKVAREVIGIQDGYDTFCTMHIINTRKGPLFFADTLINPDPSSTDLVDIARLSAKAVRLFNYEPRMAMISYSNFGSAAEPGSIKVEKAVKTLHEQIPDMVVDGEIQIGYALNKDLRDSKWPFSKLAGKDVNTFVYPNLTSARSSYKMLQALEVDTEIIGPIQIGLNKPVHFVDFDSSVRDVLNVVAIAVIDAYVREMRA